MRVLLTIPSWSYETVHPRSMGLRRGVRKWLGSAGGASEPLGLLYLAATLRAAGHEVQLADGAVLAHDEILAAAQSFQPTLVGVSCMTHTWDAAKQLVSALRDALSESKIVVGGPHVTGWRDECLSECEQIDFAIVGDGEETLTELCEALESGGSLSCIEGLAWRKGDNVVVNPPRQPARDLDSIPYPDYSLIDLHRYRPSIGFYRALPSVNMITSRGCPHRCTFCVSDGRLRLRSVRSVLDEMELLIREYGVRHVTFYDEGLTVSKERTLEICEGMIERGIMIPWCANARVDEIDEQQLSKMKQAGCWKLLYGIESGVQKNLDAVRKGVTLEQCRRAVELTKRAGIETFGTFLFGIPGETYEEALKTIEFACELPFDYAAFLNLVPYKGTEIYANLDKYGRLTGRWSTNLICFVPHTMTEAEMANLNALANRTFYRRPRYLLRRLLSIRSFQDLKRNLTGLFSYARMRSGDWE